MRNLGTIFNLLKNYPLLIVVAILVGGAWYSYEIFYAREKLTFEGVPKENSLSLKSYARVFRNDAFLVGYSEYRKSPLWVSYRVSKVPDGSKSLKRPSYFKSDERVFFEVTHKDYTHSGYDRGHLAPNYAISTLYGKEAQLETFLMSNIVPQKPNLNRKLWQRLEEVEVKHFTNLADEIWVVTGPIYDENIEELESGVEIPDKFFKIYAMKRDNSVEFLSFIMPQDVKGNERLDKFLSSVDEVEALTNFDFFHKLEDKIEIDKEMNSNPKLWNLERVSNIKGRY